MVQSWAPGDCRLSSVLTPVYVYFFSHCRDIARIGAKSTSSPKSHCSPSHNKSKSNTFVGERVLMDMIWVGCRSLWGTFGRHAILPMHLASMRLGLLRLLFAPVKHRPARAHSFCWLMTTKDGRANCSRSRLFLLFYFQCSFADMQLFPSRLGEV